MHCWQQSCQGTSGLQKVSVNAVESGLNWWFCGDQELDSQAKFTQGLFAIKSVEL